jgi:hypothetical protein
MEARKANPAPSPVEPAYETYVEEPGADLRYYWHVVWRRKFGILGLAFAAGLFAMVWAFSLQPVFRSTATLLVGGDQPLIEIGQQGQQAEASRGAQDDFFRTQVQLLQSREVAGQALKHLEEQSPGFDPIGSQPEPGFDWRQWIPRLGALVRNSASGYRSPRPIRMPPCYAGCTQGFGWNPSVTPP